MSNAKPNPEHYDLRQIISWTCVNGLPLFIASAGTRVSETETAKVDSVLIFSHLYKNSWKCLTLFIASAGTRVSETETAKVDSVLIFSHLYKNSWKCLTFLMILWPIKFFFLDLQPTKFS